MAPVVICAHKWIRARPQLDFPVDDDKARLVQETGLQLKQINNWFINQRKRNWHSNPSSSTAVKTKRKRHQSRYPLVAWSGSIRKILWRNHQKIYVGTL
ncbi:hypothetical protein OSB04_un000838 [Centaurea solstitialis]|uniref:Homeobox domain-containing protein n=1 Tax=Centaurea solstitialis TaxID=347529 RepID=A0AA38SH80_9ASTR|nr:hypothetical protein OSB04_un000838 [Centaurea solstitialis]